MFASPLDPIQIVVRLSPLAFTTNSLSHLCFGQVKVSSIGEVFIDPPFSQLLGNQFLFGETAQYTKAPVWWGQTKAQLPSNWWFVLAVWRRSGFPSIQASQSGCQAGGKPAQMALAKAPRGGGGGLWTIWVRVQMGVLFLAPFLAMFVLCVFSWGPNPYLIHIHFGSCPMGF